MKKYLVYLILLISTILFTSKVKALELDNYIVEFPYFDNTYVNLNDATDCENKDFFIISFNYAYGNLSSETENFGIPRYLSDPNRNDPTENIGLMCFNSSDITNNSYQNYNSETNTWFYTYVSIQLSNAPIYYFKYNNTSKLQMIRYNRNIFNANYGNAPADGLGNPYDYKKQAGETLYTSIYSSDNNYYILARQVLYSNINLKRCSSGNVSYCNQSYEVWNNEYLHHDPEITYSITDGTDKGKKLTINFKYFNASDKIYVHNFYTGTTEEYIYAAIAGMGNKLEYDNLNIDTTFQIEAFTENNEFIMGKNIDIALSLIDKMKDRYIKVAYSSMQNAYLVSYFNWKNTDKCYYNISNNQDEEINCDNSFTINKNDINNNSYFKVFINDEDGNTVAEKIVNYYFNNNLPQIHFDSYFDSEENKQVVEINIDKYQTGDLVFYSLDNETWVQLESKNKNKLDFYTDANLYVKVERNNNIVSNAYFKVLYKAFERSEYDDDREGFAGIVSNFRDFLDAISMTALGYGKTVYNLLVNSKLNIYILFIFVSSILIMILKSIKR